MHSGLAVLVVGQYTAASQVGMMDSQGSKSVRLFQNSYSECCKLNPFNVQRVELSTRTMNEIFFSWMGELVTETSQTFKLSQPWHTHHCHCTTQQLLLHEVTASTLPLEAASAETVN